MPRIKGKTRRLFLVPAILILFSLLSVTGTALDSRTSIKRSDITWVDFDIPSSVLKKTMELDIESYYDTEKPRICWIETLAWLGTKCGGDFKLYKSSDLAGLIVRLEAGETMEEITRDMKYYGYYLEAYRAVLGGFLGEFEIESTAEDGKVFWESRYGLKAHSPIAKNFPYSDYDDFGSSRSYGYKRRHLGHDLLSATGTPVIAIESGTVEELGWNQYGGWRIGIRSFDGYRYYYYAHLRQNRPYAEGLEKGDTVMSGDVIGYVGRTGYSASENINGIKQSHLHLGLQLVFDEAEKEGVNQIWIDLYELTKFLWQNRSETLRNPDTKEHTRAVGWRESVPYDRFIPPASEETEDIGE